MMTWSSKSVNNVGQIQDNYKRIADDHFNDRPMVGPSAVNVRKLTYYTDFVQS